MCESIIAAQISAFIHERGLLSQFQSGFRPQHSCSTAMTKILDDIRVQYDNVDLTLPCLLDFSKAFDLLIHSLLCKKHRHLFGFTDSAVRLMSSYLEGRSQKVGGNDTYSVAKTVASGVPQGSVLGPLLFSLFGNDVFSVCRYVNGHAFADDIELYLSSPVASLRICVSELIVICLRYQYGLVIIVCV